MTKPTLDDLSNPYVLKLIMTISKLEDRLEAIAEKLVETVGKRTDEIRVEITKDHTTVSIAGIDHGNMAGAKRWCDLTICYGQGRAINTINAILESGVLE